MNIYPYNYYILYFAIFLLIVFIILSLLRLRPLLSALKEMNTNVEGITKETNAMNEKLALLPKPDPNKKPSPIGVKDVLGGLMVLRAILKDKKASGQKGIKQLRNSTTKIMNKRMQQRTISDTILKILKH